MFLPKVKKYLPKKILTASFLAFLSLFVFTTIAFAYSPQSPSTNGTSPTTTATQESGEVKGAEDVVNAIGNFFTGVGGNIISVAMEIVEKGGRVVMDRVFVKGITGCSVDDKGCQQQAVAEAQDGRDVSEMTSPGALVFLASAADDLSTMPVPIDTKTYFASINPFKEAQASGFDDLQGSKGLLKVWVTLRNAAYALSVVVIVIIGFMVMLRMPLDPRTVVTAQSAIPRLVIALILITFSFAISGLIIDFGRLSLDGVHWLFSEVGIDFTKMIVKLMIILVFGGGVIGFLIANWPGALIGILIMALFLLFILAYLIFKMINRFAQFIILSVLAPFIFLLAAIPGREGVAIEWLRRQIANILAIPAIVFVVSLSYVVINTSIPSPFGPGNNPFGLFSLLGPTVIAIGIFFTATKAPEIVDELLSVKPIARSAGGAGVVFAPIMGAGQMGRAMSGLGGVGQWITGRHMGVPPGSPPGTAPTVQYAPRGPLGSFVRWINRGFGSTGGGPGGPGKCLAANMRVDTPNGLVPIKAVREGVSVWTKDYSGKCVSALVSAVIKSPVPIDHQMVHLVLGDGRRISATFDHPTLDGRTFNDISVGELYDGVKIVQIRHTTSRKSVTYDILPAGDTGIYWANGVPIRSVLASYSKRSSLKELLSNIISQPSKQGDNSHYRI